MLKYKSHATPIGKIVVKKIYINKRTGQATIILPKKQFKGNFPKQMEVSYW
jgi:hypothetical protein